MSRRTLGGRWILCSFVSLLATNGCRRAHDLLTVSPNALSFSVPSGAASPPNQSILLRAGRFLQDSLSWSATSNQSWLSVSPSSGVLSPQESATLSFGVNGTSQVEAWLGATSTVGAPFVDSNTPGGGGAWVGNALLIWNGDPTVPAKYYDPVSNTWYGATSTVGMLSQRWGFTAVWTGTEMILWGGYLFSNGAAQVAYNTGARYNPATDTWTPTSTVGAPSPRAGHSAIWTGRYMIVWGGDGLNYTYKNNGGIYDPSTDTWVGTTSLVNAPPARGSHAAVWTGTQMIVWGGENPGKFNTGYFYDPATDTWTGTTSLVGAPTARSHITGAWTGREMIIWGGDIGGGNDQGDGSRYNPVTDTWVPMTNVGAPSPRSAHVMRWTGTELIIWGGNDGTWLNTGALYQPPGLSPGLYSAEAQITATVPGFTFSVPVKVTLNVTP